MTEATKHPNEVIDTLLEWQKGANHLREIQIEIWNNQQASFARILTAKYKIYVIFILLIGMILWLNVLPLVQAKKDSANAKFEKSQQQILQLDNEIAKYQKTKLLLFNIEKYQNAVLSCINQNQKCEDLSPELSEKIDTVMAFLQLGKLESHKMKIDEKKILRNLDQYLIKKDPSQQSSSKNGMILAIHIGDEQVSKNDETMIELPVSVKIEFDGKDNLVSFVRNIEKSIILDPEDRILYTIKAINYDMMSYDQKQESTIELIAYYFK